ncbi:MAG: hypothetical protein Q8O47_04600 [Candidatus Bathyarchaeota archaeon]|nr:hypothetical protein [Candidatus Bathyarchaeota archaeon]
MVDKETLKNRIVRIIAATRFPFVDQEDWGEGYITIVNDEIKRKGIETGTEIVYPSIVITLADGRIQEIGEVELEEDINVANVPRWRLFSESAGKGRFVKKLFLYIPEGVEEKTVKLLENNNIEFSGVRTYAVKNGTLVITPIKSNDGPHDHR